jgi:hypothetical protein
MPSSWIIFVMNAVIFVGLGVIFQMQSKTARLIGRRWRALRVLAYVMWAIALLAAVLTATALLA